jgi:N-acetylglucosaminyldiphosphoundecaprenol N-acetyl-beta-D-mannosaminyltransferase
MIDQGKKSVLGILVDAVDYEAALERILRAASEKRSYAVSALAVHGVMTGVESEEHKYRLNSFDLIVPDGQPVRWALNLIHKSGLDNRVYGWAASASAFRSSLLRGRSHRSSGFWIATRGLLWRSEFVSPARPSQW